MALPRYFEGLNALLAEVNARNGYSVKRRGRQLSVVSGPLQKAEVRSQRSEDGGQGSARIEVGGSLRFDLLTFA